VLILGLVAAALGVVVVLELAALAGRRAWVHWRIGHRGALVDEAVTTLVDAVVLGTPVDPPAGRVRRRAFRLATLELLPALAGPSRDRLTWLVAEAGLDRDVRRTLERSPRAYARRTAADELGELGSAGSAAALRAGLEDRDAIVRIACVRGLARLPELSRLPRMVEILDRDAPTDPAGATSAMLALGAASPDALAELERSGRSSFARALAALALARAGDVRALPSLRAAAASDNTLVSSVAIHAIALVGGAEAAGSLESVLRDPDRDATLRELAGSELEALGGGSR
jgi:HEAT repeat protein